MLTCEGNENGEKTTIGLICKKATLQVQHTFLVHFFARCFARLQHETSQNFLVTRSMEEMSYVLLFTFHAFVVHCCLFSSWWLLAFLISHCCYFHVLFPTKKVSFVFSFRSSCLSLFFWLSFADLLPTFSLSLYLKFVDMTIYLSLIL